MGFFFSLDGVETTVIEVVYRGEGGIGGKLCAAGSPKYDCILLSLRDRCSDFLILLPCGF